MIDTIRPRSLLLAGFLIGTLVCPSTAQTTQASARCSSEFDWASNDAGMSPCLVAAYVSDACTGSGWSVDPLGENQHYEVFSDRANACSCSWAAYNLLQACTACQGFVTSIQNWASISTGTNCSGYISEEEYFPRDTRIRGDIGIPFWAGVNPLTWNHGRFNVDEAKVIAASGVPDLSTVQTEASSGNPNVGAIVGGVIGGIVVLAIGALTAVCILHRKRKASGRPGLFTRRSHDKGHVRDVSNASQDSEPGIFDGYHRSYHHSRTPSEAPLMTGTGTLRTTPTIHTHSGSVASLSQFGAFNRSNFSGSPPPAEPIMPIIEPFTLPHPTSPTSAKSTSNHSGYFRPTTPHQTVSGGSNYEASIAPSSSRGAEDTGFPATPRRRINPPAYSPYPGGESPGSTTTITSSPSAAPPAASLSPLPRATGRPEKGGHYDGPSAPPSLSPVPEPPSPLPGYVDPPTPSPSQRATSPLPTHRPTTPSFEDEVPIA